VQEQVLQLSLLAPSQAVPASTALLNAGKGKLQVCGG
jgi:hypothetical protein